ncbi:MAG: hypothetical protein AAF677_15300 [Pseudomonadota bacterium]
MANQIECFVLLRGGWKPTVEAFCATLDARYPALAPFTGEAGDPEAGLPYRLLVDGAEVTMTVVNAPYPPEQFYPPIRLTETADVDALVEMQLAYVLLSATAPQMEPAPGEDDPAHEPPTTHVGGDPSVELAEGYAAAVTLVASVVAAASPSLAAFWRASWRLVPCEVLHKAAERVMAGDPPRDLWVSTAEIRGQRAGGGDNLAMTTFGLRRFVGREVELSPAPVAKPAAEALVRELVGKLLDGQAFEDRASVVHPKMNESATLRLADRFLRASQRAAVLVLPSSIHDAETLTPKRGAAKRGGFVNRLFGG